MHNFTLVKQQTNIMKAEILDLLFKTNKNYNEIAVEVGCSAKYVRSLHKDALDSLKRVLKAKPVERFHCGVSLKEFTK